MSAVTIQINGETREVQAGLSVRSLLQELALAEKPVVLELNERALLPREYENTAVQAGDRLEVVQITAGG